MRPGRIFLIGWWFLVGFTGFGIPASEGAEVFLGVDRSEATRIPVSLLYVSTPAALAKYSSRVTAVFEINLHRSPVY